MTLKTIHLVNFIIDYIYYLSPYWTFIIISHLVRLFPLLVHIVLCSVWSPFECPALFPTNISLIGSGSQKRRLLTKWQKLQVEEINTAARWLWQEEKQNRSNGVLKTDERRCCYYKKNVFSLKLSRIFFQEVMKLMTIYQSLCSYCEHLEAQSKNKSSSVVCCSVFVWRVVNVCVCQEERKKGRTCGHAWCVCVCVLHILQNMYVGNTVWTQTEMKGK